MSIEKGFRCHGENTHASGDCLCCSNRTATSGGSGAGVMAGTEAGNTAALTVRTPPATNSHPLSKCMRTSECDKLKEMEASVEGFHCVPAQQTFRINASSRARKDDSKKSQQQLRWP